MDIRIISRRKIERPRIRPVYVMQEPGVTASEKQAVLDGIDTVLREAGVEDRIPVKDFGVWRQGSGDYESVDWYIEQARNAGRRRGNEIQLNGSDLLFRMGTEPWKKHEDHYDVMVCSSDMWDGQDTNFVIGIARPHDSTAFSTRRFRVLDERMKRECIKTETIHELGHVFGLPSRTENVTYSLGNHCTNICSMRQGLTVPHDWINYTRDRIDS